MHAEWHMLIGCSVRMPCSYIGGFPVGTKKLNIEVWGALYFVVTPKSHHKASVFVQLLMDADKASPWKAHCSDTNTSTLSISKLEGPYCVENQSYRGFDCAIWCINFWPPTPLTLSQIHAYHRYVKELETTVVTQLLKDDWKGIIGVGSKVQAQTPDEIKETRNGGLLMNFSALERLSSMKRYWLRDRSSQEWLETTLDGYTKRKESEGVSEMDSGTPLTMGALFCEGEVVACITLTNTPDDHKEKLELLKTSREQLGN